MPRRGENIRKRKDGRWEGRYYMQDVLTGRNVLHSVYARSYGEVRLKLSEAKLSVENRVKEACISTEIPFHKAAEEWLSSVSCEKKYATYMKYRMIYEKHIRKKMEGVPFSKLSKEILADIFQQEGEEPLSDSLRKSISCVLNQICTYAFLRYQISSPQYSPPRYKTGEKPAEILNRSEQSRLLQCLYHEMDTYKLGIVICISTGLRLGEICSLKWKDIDFEEKILYVNRTVQRIAVEGTCMKTALLEGEPKSMFSKREIPLSDELMKLFFSYYEDSEEYVINRAHPMEPRTYQNKFQKYLQSAGVKKKNFHTLRHTFATNCINEGVDLKSLSEILGHSDVKITLNRYVHPTTEMKRKYMNSLAAIYGQFWGH